MYMISPIWAFQVAQWVKNPPAMQEMLVQSQCPQDPLEEGMATRFSILAWRIPRTEEPRVCRIAEIRHDCSDWAYTHTQLIMSSTQELTAYKIHLQDLLKEIAGLTPGAADSVGRPEVGPQTYIVNKLLGHVSAFGYHSLRLI